MVHLGPILSNSLRLPLGDTHALTARANGMAQAATAHEAQAVLRQEINAAALKVFEDRSQLEEGVLRTPSKWHDLTVASVRHRLDCL